VSPLTVVNFLTLDGVMQAPGHADEDRRGGFEHGGWQGRYGDPVMAEYMGRGASAGGALLFGRRTYEKMAAVWPHAPADNPFTDIMNNRRKYVCSTTLAEPLEWNNSTLLAGDAAESVAGLKEREEAITILGSGELIRSLMPHALIDAYVLAIHPLVMGTGVRMFGGAYAELELVESLPTTTGVIITRYAPAGTTAPRPGASGSSPS
jgi:dihydrofolate reductase